MKINSIIGLAISSVLFCIFSSQPFLAARVLDYACSCQPEVSPKGEFRYESKHVRLPKTPAEDITIEEITDWIPQYFPGETFSPETPRQDRELRLFHISHAFLQAAWINRGDCDFHLEISPDGKKGKLMPWPRQPPCLLNNIHKAITDRDRWISPESRRTKHMDAILEKTFNAHPRHGILRLPFGAIELGRVEEFRRRTAYLHFPTSLALHLIFCNSRGETILTIAG